MVNLYKRFDTFCWPLCMGSDHLACGKLSKICSVSTMPIFVKENVFTSLVKICPLNFCSNYGKPIFSVAIKLRVWNERNYGEEQEQGTILSYRQKNSHRTIYVLFIQIVAFNYTKETNNAFFDRNESRLQNRTLFVLLTIVAWKLFCRKDGLCFVKILLSLFLYSVSTIANIYIYSYILSAIWKLYLNIWKQTSIFDFTFTNLRTDVLTCQDLV